MNPLLRLESLLREAFERPIWALGGQRLHPAQLGALLEDAMREGRVALAGGTYVPERYALLLHPDDARRFGDLQAEVERGLTQHLQALLDAEGYRRRAPLAVTIRADEGVRAGQVEIDAAFVEERARPALSFVGGAAETELDGPAGATMAIDRRAVLAAIGRGAAEEPSPDAVAVLMALGDDGREGPHEAGYGVEALPCVIGRAPDCDIMLYDLRVSRRHARIVRDGDALTIEDLGSSNGTWRNGERVERAPLAEGDTIALGGPRFRVRLRPSADGGEA